MNKKNLETGNVVSFQRLSLWADFFKLLENTSVPADFLDKKEREQAHDLKCAQDPFESSEKKRRNIVFSKFFF